MAGGEQSDYWLQQLIVTALSIGIGKRELFEEYYYDEIWEIFKAYNDLHNRTKDETVEYADADSFFGF